MRDALHPGEVSSMNPNQFSDHRPDEKLTNHVVFGNSPAMKALRAMIPVVAASSDPILISGESGAGKEVVARIIHNLSPGAPRGKFVVINCAGADPFEIECFEPKSTQVPQSYKEAIESGGTLFLDHIDKLNSLSQARLLQLMKNGTLDRVDRSYKRKVEIRLVCATTKDAKAEVERGSFRRDLYDRISVISLRVPSLREHPEDIGQLAQHFVKFFNDKFDCQAKLLSSELTKALELYEWPGNLRELANLMKRYVIVASEEALAIELQSKDQERQVRSELATITADHSISLKRLTKAVVKHFEYCTIMRVLEACNWNKRAAARALNISYRTLQYRMKELRPLKPLSQHLQQNLLGILADLLQADSGISNISSRHDPSAPKTLRQSRISSGTDRG